MKKKCRHARHIDSSSVFSSGSFDIIRDSRRWLIIAGQDNKAFAAQQCTYAHREGGEGGGRKVTREKVRGAMVHKAGRKYQHN
jgi:hypothetical protein